MRNLFHVTNYDNVFLVDFLKGELSLEDDRRRLKRALMVAFGKETERFLTPSEEGVMNAFNTWFLDFRTAGQKISANYPRTSTSNDLPASTAFTYVNCNTGVGVTIIGLYNEGYGDFTFGGNMLW